MRTSVEPSDDPATYPFAQAIRVRFAETDAMGIVHHAAYLPYLEEARVAYLRELAMPYQELRRDGVDLAVLEVFVSYDAPLRFDDVVDVHVALADVGRATLQMAYLLTVDGGRRSRAVTVHAAVDTTTGRPRRMPERLLGVGRGGVGRDVT